MGNTEQCYKTWGWTKQPSHVFQCFNEYEEYNMDVVANSFNHFFVTAEANLARTITDPGTAEDRQKSLFNISHSCR